MNKKIVIIIVTLIITVIVISIILFKMFFIKYEKEIRSMPSIEAIRNPFLAAERFLLQTGKNAQSLSDRKLLIDLPSVNDLIIINIFGGNLPEDREELLISWIENGGSLIVTANRLWDEKLLKSGNNLFDRYGIRPVVKSEDEENNKFWDVDNQKSVIDIKFLQNEVAKVSFAKNQTLEDSDGIADETFSGENGAHFIQIKIGQGRLIFLSDNEFLKNRNIEKNDHAYFLANLVQGRSKIWLLYSSNMPSLLSLIWKNAFYFVICFCILLLFCILRLNLKSGPLIPQNNNTRRNLMEHLEASGNYLFKLDKGTSMLKKVQKSTKRSLKERYFFTTQKLSPEQSTAIAKQANIKPKEVHEALFGSIEDEHDFIDKTVVLQKLTSRFRTSLKR
ncbi:MAG: DUF4350 domain-containing protein [Desulfobacteraceae bacterium]|nr:DUF4350 domain-containing protein [Desulfobacteraceae bacterium]